MMKLRLLFAVAIVVSVSVHCKINEVHIPIFTDVAPLMQMRIFNATVKVNDYLSSGATTFDIFAAAYLGYSRNESVSDAAEKVRQYAPLIHDLAAVVSNGAEFLFNNHTQALGLSNYAFQNIMVEMEEIQQTFNSIIFGEKKYTENDVESLILKLNAIVDIFANETFHLRKYPLLAVPILLSLAPTAAIITEHSKSLGKEANVSCNLAAIIKQHFQPFIFDRFMRIGLENNQGELCSVCLFLNIIYKICNKIR